MKMSQLVLSAALLSSSLAVMAAPTAFWTGDAGAVSYKVFCEPAPLSGGPYTPVYIGTGSAATEGLRQLDLEELIPVGQDRECWVLSVDPYGQDGGESLHVNLQWPEPLAPPAQFYLTW